MHLDGKRVLLDGLNLELPQGSGIKTYGLSLIRALRSMAIEPFMLTSRKSRHRDPVINTDPYALFPNHADPHGKHRWYGVAARSIFRLSNRLRSMPATSDLILPQGLNGFSFINEVDLFSFPGCFEISQFLLRHGQTVRIRTTPRMDLFHATYPTPIRIPGVPKVSTIHDLIPLRLPHTTVDDKSHFLKLIRNAIQHSDLLICVSEATRNDLIRFFDVSPDRLYVTYQPIAMPAVPTDQNMHDHILQYYQLEKDRYILFVGSIEPKKNLGRLLKAYAMLDHDLPLVIVGRKAWLWEQDLDLLNRNRKLRRRVKLLDFVPYDELPTLYSNARCLAFPSLYEGFGLPPLEAMHHGCPVLTSNVPSMPEVCADAALYADPYDVADIADKLRLVIEDSALRSRLIQNGFNRVGFFSEENYRKRLAAAYAQVL